MTAATGPDSAPWRKTQAPQRSQPGRDKTRRRALENETPAPREIGADDHPELAFGPKTTALGVQVGNFNIQHNYNYFDPLSVDNQPAGLAVPKQLPHDVWNFKGRDTELWTLDLLLQRATEGPSHVPLVVISGGPGVGKTALAVRWSYTSLTAFPDGQIYIDLQGYSIGPPVSTAQALAIILEGLGYLDAQRIPDLATRSAMVRTLLADRRILVILDNAHSVSQVRPLIPGGRTSFVIVTCRDDLSGLVARDGAQRLDLARLRIEDATELLESLIGPRTTEENQQLRLLAEQCACLPLALRIAAEVVVSHPDKTVQELCLDLRDQRQRIKILSDSDDPEAAISSVLSWSYDKLQPIHASAFRRLSLHPGADYDIFAVAALLEGSAENALGVMEVLRRKNLIETLAGERFRIHDILRGYASALSHQEDSAPERLECFKRLSDYYVGTATIAMNLLFPVDREKRVGLDRVTVTGPQLTDRSGARRWLTSERANIAQIAGLPRSSQGAAELLQTVWRFYTTSGYYDDAHRIADASMKSARDSGDSAAEAVALQLSGLISILEGRPDRAPESLLQAIDIQRANVIPAVLATSLFYLGQAYAHMGEYTRALVHHQDALALYKVANDRLGIANAEGNIGYVLWRLGRYTESYASHGKALRQHWALRHEPGVASTLDSLGRLNRSMGRIRKAIQQHRTAVRRQRQLEHHLGEAKAFENLGLCYSVLKDFPVARRQFDEALAICDVRGFERLERRILNSRAEAALASKDVRNAERDYATVLASAVPAGDREEEARACKGVCEIREVEGRPAEAVGFARRSLDIYRALGVPEAIAAADRFDALLRHCGT